MPKFAALFVAVALAFCLQIGAAPAAGDGGTVFTPVNATACQTVEVLKEIAAKNDIPASAISVVEGSAFVNDYSKALGIALPDDTAPTGILFIGYGANGVMTFAGLIEPNGCIVYSIKMPTAKHEAALARIKAGV